MINDRATHTTRNDPNNFQAFSTPRSVAINHKKPRVLKGNRIQQQQQQGCTHILAYPCADYRGSLAHPWIRELRTFHGTWIRGWQSGPILFHRSEIEGGGRERVGSGKVSIAAMWLSAPWGVVRQPLREPFLFRDILSPAIFIVHAGPLPSPFP